MEPIIISERMGQKNNTRSGAVSSSIVMYGAGIRARCQSVELAFGLCDCQVDGGRLEGGAGGVVVGGTPLPRGRATVSSFPPSNIQAISENIFILLLALLLWLLELRLCDIWYRTRTRK